MSNNAVYNADYVLQRIETEKPMKIDIWQGFIGNPQNINPFLRLDARGGTVEDVIKSFKKFLADTPHGEFTIYSRIGDKTSFRNSAKMYMALGQNNNAPAAFFYADQPKSKEVDVEALVNQKIEEYKRSQELEALKLELEKSKQFWGNIRDIVSEVAQEIDFSSILKIIPRKQAPFNGASSTPPMNGTQPTQDELARAYRTLTDLFGASGIVEIAKKLENDPGKVEMVKTFL
jgi:hypothetical protein